MTHFPDSEYRARVSRVQAGMVQAGLDALLLTTEPDVRYITGFYTRFWESPTRPWFVVLPATGDPVAVIPSIGAHLMAQGWIRDIRTWRAPDYDDDGVSLLADTLRELAPGGCVGVPSGLETHLRMPLADWALLQARAGGVRFGDDRNLMRDARMIKSAGEIAAIRAACSVAGQAFAQVPGFARVGVPLSEVFRSFQIACLAAGADWVPYVAGAAGQGGYGDVISPATGAPLQRGDVLMLDTGLVRAGYFCDFDRNFSLGPPSPEVSGAHKRLIAATRAAFDMARPGVRACDLFHAMDGIVTHGAGGSDAGRLGHGLGQQLTEAPSLIAADQTVLQAGMVLTLEPGIALAPGRILVHEENIVITETGAAWLSDPAAEDILVIDA